MSPGLENNHTMNFFLAVFQHNHIFQDCWKNTQSTIECMIILKSRGHGPKKIENYGTRIWTLFPGLENNHKFKCWSGIFRKILIYMIMLENCQNNISVYSCSLIQGTKFSSCWNLMSQDFRVKHMQYVMCDVWCVMCYVPDLIFL